MKGLGFRILSCCCLALGSPRGVGRATVIREEVQKHDRGEHEEDHDQRDNIDEQALEEVRRYTWRGAATLQSSHL